MNVSAVKASLGRWIEAINQPNRFALEGCNILEYAHELTTGKVTNLASPKRLHPFHGKVFKVQMIVAVGQLMGQLKEPVTPLVDHGLIQAGDVGFSLLPVVGEFDLARQLALSGFQFGQSLTIEQRAFNLLPVRCGEEDFQPKVKACAVTRHGLMVLGYIFLYHKVQVEIVKTITLDRDRLNVCWNVAGLAEFVDRALNLDLVAAQQLPTGLLEREGAIPLDLLKAGWGCTNLVLEIAKEELISLVDTLNNILNGLTANQIPVGILLKLFQLGDMLHQDKLVQALARQLVVAAMQRNAVVVDQPCNVNLLVQQSILFLPVELELVRLDDFHALFWFSIYCMMTASGAPPTVQTK